MRPSFLPLSGDNDFVVVEPSETFVASAVGNKLCIDIPIISDVVYEGNEQFVVKFVNVPDAANRVGVGDISQTCVTIIDDDG